MVAEELPKFEDRFPHCLPHTVVVDRDLDAVSDEALIQYIQDMKRAEYN